MMSAIYRTLLTEVEADGYHVLQHRISLTPIRKLWLAWKTYIRG
jgi:phytoene synthase